MARTSARESIIRHGALLIHSKGYNNTGLADVLKAAKVPKGSFYFYFKSKDELGLAVLDHYWEFIQGMAGAHCSDPGIPPWSVSRASSTCITACSRTWGSAAAAPSATSCRR
jgi:TetR/AcrR family transcriptional regulator, transcriptional repressor for nem operon